MWSAAPVAAVHNKNREKAFILTGDSREENYDFDDKNTTWTKS